MYGKIFESMYDGTLYGQWEALITFQQMIVLADQDGVVDITPPALAARTSIPLKYIEKGIEVLEQEDPYSRTDGNSGRRIERLDDHRPWGWRIVNHTYYRNLASAEDKRRKDRERIASKRAEIKGVAMCRKLSQGVVNVAYTDTDTDTEEIYKENFKFKKKVCLPFQFYLTDQMKAYANKKRYIGNLDTFTEYFISKNKASGNKYKDWYSAWQSWLQKDIEWHPENQEEDLVTL